MFLGGETITISGSNLPTGIATLLIGSTQAKILSSSSSEITVLSPQMKPGLYNIAIPTNTIGNAK